MGTVIELKVAGLSISYSKNSMGIDHGVLFQVEDRQRRLSDQIDYEYYEQNPEDDLSDHEAAFVRPLSRVLPRLNLLGFTLNAARAEYEELVRQELELRSDPDPEEDVPVFLSFDEYCIFVCQYPLSSLDDTYIEFDLDNRYDLVKGRFGSMENVISRIPKTEYSDSYWSEQSYFCSVACVLNSYSMLQVFAQSPSNADAEVMWQYGPIVDAGWVALEDFNPMVRRGQTILIVTEGSSDARIIKHALNLLCADVADFFRFVDLEGAHPFWGTGNLVKFAEGLLRIDVHNQIIFVLDNDAEGLDAFQRLSKLSLPVNMRAMMLPDMDNFRQFPARGPEGVVNCDINGRAVAIECYLDLDLPGYAQAHVQWSNYKKEVGAWQGALEHKETYMRRFLAETKESLENGRYDVSKLKVVLKALISEATILIGGQN
jgi:hypothetical protein